MLDFVDSETSRSKKTAAQYLPASIFIVYSFNSSMYLLYGCLWFIWEIKLIGSQPIASLLWRSLRVEVSQIVLIGQAVS